MSDEFKRTNHGGARSGAGRKTNFELEQSGNTKDTYKPRINVLKEIEKIYKSLKGNKISKEDLEFVKTKLDLLNKLLPYVEMKKPTASIITENSSIPEMTILTVDDGDKTKEEQNKQTDNKQTEDFV
jgi:hypothetical protein